MIIFIEISFLFYFEKNSLRMKKLLAKNRSTNEDLEKYFIKISSFGNHNAAIDDKGCLYTWGERLIFQKIV